MDDIMAEIDRITANHNEIVVLDETVVVETVPAENDGELAATGR